MKRLISIFLIIFIACASFQFTMQNTNTSIGIITKNPMITKGGTKSSYATDYYFKTDKKYFFIKLAESNITSDSLNLYVDKKIQLKYVIKTGSWDGNGQSRIGEYITILKLIKI